VAMPLAIPDDPAVECLILEFEAAMWRVAEQMLPEVEKQGCAFHRIGWCGGKLRNFAWPLSTAMTRILPLLPQEIVGAFGCLSARATTPVLTQLFTHTDNTWIASALWPPSWWSVFDRPIRTNNDVKG
ncbi:hypothetical protein LSAT2_032295, partial [Lamellibrachia satsuma]